MDTPEFICIRCARHMKTCCQTSEVYATPGDVERIAEHTGQRDFYHFAPPEDPIYLQQDDDPIWPQLVFKTPEGVRRVLKRRPDGDCIFLGEQGCILPLETRPLVCRIYPYDYNEQGIKPQLAHGCPIELLPATTGNTDPLLLQALDMKQDAAERWHQQLYAELPLERTADDYRTDL